MFGVIILVHFCILFCSYIVFFFLGTYKCYYTYLFFCIQTLFISCYWTLWWHVYGLVEYAFYHLLNDFMTSTWTVWIQYINWPIIGLEAVSFALHENEAIVEVSVRLTLEFWISNNLLTRTEVALYQSSVDNKKCMLVSDFCWFSIRHIWALK